MSFLLLKSDFLRIKCITFSGSTQWRKKGNLARILPDMVHCLEREGGDFMRETGIYIHIPFCVKKCAYCDFLSGPAGEKEKEEYVKMLVDEIRNCPDTVQNYRVISVFFGGGTPSLLTGEQIGRLMDTVREIFTLYVYFQYPPYR